MDRPEIIGYSQDGPMDQWGAKLQSQSEGAPSKPPAPQGSLRCDGGFGLAVPVCELENIAESWLHRHATSLEPTDNLLYCRDELRRLTEAAKKRQPQPNGTAQP